MLEQKKDAIRKLRSFRSSTSFNEKEAMIWKKRPTAAKNSSDLNDYYQAVKEEEFMDSPIYLERSPELKEAEQKIENEIKRFERSLQKKIGKEDFNKLKKYRLINSLISVRDLKNPADLFKDSNELISSTNATVDDKKETQNYLSPERFERRIRQLHGNVYASMSELNNAKKETEQLIKLMQSQGNEDAVKKIASIIERIRVRRTLRPISSAGHYGLEKTYFVGIDNIEDKAKEVLDKKYNDVSEIKLDRQRLDDMIKNFIENNGEEGKRQLESIRFLLDRVDFKITRGL